MLSKFFITSADKILMTKIIYNRKRKLSDKGEMRMKTMRKLYDQTMEELDGVIEYANCSTAHRDNPDLSKIYLSMAKQELEHAQTLHNVSKKLAESKIGEQVDPMLMEL